jgi:hypothetical protein
MRLTILGESMLVFALRMSGSALRKGTSSFFLFNHLAGAGVVIENG